MIDVNGSLIGRRNVRTLEEAENEEATPVTVSNITRGPGATHSQVNDDSKHGLRQCKRWKI